MYSSFVLHMQTSQLVSYHNIQNRYTSKFALLHCHNKILFPRSLKNFKLNVSSLTECLWTFYSYTYPLKKIYCKNSKFFWESTKIYANILRQSTPFISSHWCNILKDDAANNTFIQNITGSNDKTIILLPFKIIIHRKKNPFVRFFSIYFPRENKLTLIFLIFRARFHQLFYTRIYENSEL